MTDAIQVLKPGWRALDANGNPYSGALLQFFDAGTSNTREVFSNYGLDASLGVEVECDAGGYPTSDGSTKVEVYTGNTPYKLTLKDADGAAIWSHDNIIGALDTSGFLTDEDVVPETPISNTATNQAPALADKGTYYNVNCSGGDVTITLDNASDLDDGWFIKVRHDGTANQVLLLTTSGELMKIGSHAGVSAFALTQRGQVITVTCDGVGFKIEQSSPALFNTTGVILVADRAAVAPGSPAAGARYIATAADTWASLSVSEHDLVEADGQGNFFKITPPTDCGWLAYVQDEDAYYAFFGSAWVAFKHPATQAEMEAASSSVPVVTPANMKWHPGVAKFWLVANADGGILASHNITSISDGGTGLLSVTINEDISSANYAILATVERITTSLSSNINAQIVSIRNSTRAAGSFTLDSVVIATGSNNLVLSDPQTWHVAGFGDL